MTTIYIRGMKFAACRGKHYLRWIIWAVIRRRSYYIRWMRGKWHPDFITHRMD